MNCVNRPPFRRTGKLQRPISKPQQKSSSSTVTKGKSGPVQRIHYGSNIFTNASGVFVAVVGCKVAIFFSPLDSCRQFKAGQSLQFQSFPARVAMRNGKLRPVVRGTATTVLSYQFSSSGETITTGRDVFMWVPIVGSTFAIHTSKRFSSITLLRGSHQELRPIHSVYPRSPHDTGSQFLLNLLAFA